MIWEILGIFLFVFVMLGTYRVYKTERIRLKCLELSIMARDSYAGNGGTTILLRAAIFENYVRKGPEKQKEAEDPG